MEIKVYPLVILYIKILNLSRYLSKIVKNLMIVTTMMKDFDTWEEFDKAFRKAFNVPDKSIPILTRNIIYKTNDQY